MSGASLSTRWPLRCVSLAATPVFSCSLLGMHGSHDRPQRILCHPTAGSGLTFSLPVQDSPSASCLLAAALNVHSVDALQALLSLGELPAAPWPGAAGTTTWHAAAGPRGMGLRALIEHSKARDHTPGREHRELRRALRLVDDLRRTPLHYAAMGSEGSRMRDLLEHCSSPKE